MIRYMFQFFSENRWQTFLTVIIVGVSHLISLAFAPWVWCFWIKLMLFGIALTFWARNHMVIYGPYRFLFLLCVVLVLVVCMWSVVESVSRPVPPIFLLSLSLLPFDLFLQLRRAVPILFWIRPRQFSLYSGYWSPNFSSTAFFTDPNAL